MKYLSILVFFICTILHVLAIDTASARIKLVQTALGWQGIPYVWGGTAPSGFDCSGFTQAVYRKGAEIEIPRNVKGQYRTGEAVTLDEAEPGDLFIFDTCGGPTHVGVFLGGGKVAHAASAGTKTGIIVSAMSESYYKSRFIGARSVLGKEKREVPIKTSSSQEPDIPNTIIPPATDPTDSQNTTAGPWDEEFPEAIMSYTIASRSLIYNDRLPCYTETRVEFGIENASGKADLYTIMVVKGDFDSGTYEVLSRETIKIESGKTFRSKAFIVAKPDWYQLVITKSDGTLAGKRIFKAITRKN